MTLDELIRKLQQINAMGDISPIVDVVITTRKGKNTLGRIEGTHVMNVHQPEDDLPRVILWGKVYE